MHKIQLDSHQVSQVFGAQNPLLRYSATVSRSMHDACAADVWSVGVLYCAMVFRDYIWDEATEHDEAFRQYLAVSKLGEEISSNEVLADEWIRRITKGSQ